MIVFLNDVLKDNVVFQFNFHNLEFLKAILEVHYLGEDFVKGFMKQRNLLN